MSRLTQVDLFPFSYSKALRRAQIPEILSRLAAAHELTWVRTSLETFAGITPDAIEQADRELLADEQRQALSSCGLYPLSKAGYELLGRAIPITVYEYQRQNGPVKLILKAASKNEYGALGYDLWSKKKLTLYGGFAGVTCIGSKEDRRAARAIADDLRVALRVPPRQP